MKTRVLSGQPSWQFSNGAVTAAVTRTGGHLGPVQFRLGRRTIEPFAVAPWAEEKLPAGSSGCLRALRGDFFCAPFGGNARPWRGEKHPGHGESANGIWKFEALENDGDGSTLRLSLRPKVRPGRIEKIIHLHEGHTALYCTHVISGMIGPMPFGHHAMLRFPDTPGSGRISTSPIRFAQVLPEDFENPEKGGYSCLTPGAEFRRLDRVPTQFGTLADLSRYPARRGYEDLVLVAHAASPGFAWTAVTIPQERYVWFSLKDPRVLQSTVMWISNGGRHYPPWNGRHVNVLGIEDVTAYFHKGLAESVSANALARRGFATFRTLKDPTRVNYIMGVAEVPRGFERVRAIVPLGDRILLISTVGHRVEAPVKLSHLA